VFRPGTHFKTEGAAYYRWTLTLYDEKDTAGETAEGFFGTVPGRKQWQGKWIDPEPGRPEPPVYPETGLHNLKKMLTRKDDPIPRYPAAYLKKTFTVSGGLSACEDAFLYMTAHGVYTVYVNGKELSDWVLAPGFTQYDALLNVQAWPISGLLKEGENEILILLMDGWYRGSIDNERCVNSYGSDIALLGQLRIGSEIVLTTDETWIATSDGPLGYNDMQLGEQYDAGRTLEKAAWHKVAVKDFGYSTLLGSDCPPVKEHERLSAKLLHTPNGDTVLDFGQNIAGYVEMEFDAEGGETILLTHGETLDRDGNFTQENILVPTKPKDGYQKVRYTAAPGHNRYKPHSCFFGFRYVRVETDMEIKADQFTAVAVYSDMPVTGNFRCGNEKVNRLFSNALWSMKGNFISVMTDCPTRERSGYMGDAQVFCETGMYLMDCMPVYDHWLKSADKVFEPEEGMRMFAPNTHDAGTMDSSHGWCDAVVIIPWLLWKRTGDTAYITENYRAAKNWVDFALKRAASGNHRTGKKAAGGFETVFCGSGLYVRRMAGGRSQRHTDHNSGYGPLYACR